MMKPLERIFFQACVMKDAKETIRNIINIFGYLGFSHKQLWRYLEKWCSKGFYDYGVTLDLGWLYPNKFIGEYKVMYETIIKAGGVE